MPEVHRLGRRAMRHVTSKAVVPAVTGSRAPIRSATSRPAMPVTPITSSPVSPREATLSPSGSCSGSTPIPTRFDRWIRSKDSATTARTPRRVVPFAAQSREDPEPYSLPARTTSGTPSSR